MKKLNFLPFLFFAVLMASMFAAAVCSNNPVLAMQTTLCLTALSVTGYVLSGNRMSSYAYTSAGLMTLTDLKNRTDLTEAQKIELAGKAVLSSFEGGQDAGGYNQINHFHGENEHGMDDFDDFDAVSFDNFNESFNGKVMDTLMKGQAKNYAGKRLFQFTITNNNATSESFFLSPSYRVIPPYYALANGVPKDGAFNSIGGNPLTGASGTAIPIAEFMSYMFHNPTHCFGFKLESNNTLAVSQTINAEDLTPFRRLGTSQDFISSYVNEDTFRDKIATVKFEFAFNAQSEIIVTVPGYVAVGTPTTCTFTLMCGPSLNQYHNLRRKTARASGNMVKKHHFRKGH